MSGFARSTFLKLTIAQGVVVLAITPAIVASTIAGERSRKTLDELLASDLSSAEIVLGNLGARLVLILVLLATGLPILSLQTLIGGIGPSEVVIAVAAAASIAVFLGGLSILASVMAPGPREAVLAAYGLMACWLFASPIFHELARGSSSSFASAIEPGITLLNMTNPFFSLGRGWFDAARMVVILTASGIVLATIAVLRLRPSARGLGDPPRHRRGRWRLISRREVGDDPMRWKETQVQRPAGVVGKSARVILFLIFVGLALLTARESVDSFSDTWRFGYLANNHWWIHEHFNDFIRSAGTGLYLLTLLVVTATAAVSITAERETETWTGLIASPLTAEEILKAKRAGVYRRTWPLIAAILSIWTIGLISGAVHPYGFLASMLLLAPYLSAAAALGLFVSLHVRTTARAIGASLCLTSFLHCGYMLLCVPMSPETVVVAFGCSPFLIGVAPISPGDMRDLVSFHAPGSNFSSVGSFYTRGGEIIFTALLSILAYTVLAITLNILSAVGFDSAVDRPRRPIKRP